MKRIQLFEFEDQTWFPHWIRMRLTSMIIYMHKLLNSVEEFTPILEAALDKNGESQILDLCSGSGGPMPEIVKKLRAKEKYHNLKLSMSDLYPNESISFEDEQDGIEYINESVDARSVKASFEGLRTLVGSFHHMDPKSARQILQHAVESKKGICIFEISDNSAPRFIRWISLPINLVMALIISPFVRPFKIRDIFFTYIIPIIPLFWAWDGAVSNARTYTLTDLDELLSGIESDNYEWVKGTIKGRSRKLYLYGYPTKID